MYRMLADEIRWACDDGELYHFGHFLVISRTYVLPDEEAEATSTSFQQQKRRRGAPTPSAAGRVFSFHHEDPWIQEVRHALSTPFVQCVGIEPYSKGRFSFFGLFFIQYTSSRKRIFRARAGRSPHAVRRAQTSTARIEPRHCLSPVITVAFLACCVILPIACSLSDTKFHTSFAPGLHRNNTAINASNT